MATYIPGLTDYIPQIQPFQPDYNFLGNVLQTEQGRYDAGHKQLSSIYGTLLNSPMLRDDNIQRRDSFFKAIDKDIKKVSGLDLSKQENINAAMSVFKPLYDDKGIIKDMAWTKNWQSELQRGENFRTCVDPDKCGGSYWEGGIKALQYKADEFRKAAPNEALGFENSSYVPSVNVMDKAVKLAKDAGFKVSFDETSNGYIVTTQNGERMIAPLTSYFMSKFGGDPNVMSYYKTQAYLNRKDFIYTNAGLMGGEDEANVSYIRNLYSTAGKAITQGKYKADDDLDRVETFKNAYSTKIKKEGVLPGDKMVDEWQTINDQYGVAAGNQAIYQEASDVLDNMGINIDNVKYMGDRLDQLVGFSMLSKEVGNAAKAYADLTMERHIKADPFALQSREHSFQLGMKRMDQNFQMQKMGMEKGYTDAEGNFTPGLDFKNWEAREKYKTVKEEAKWNERLGSPVFNGALIGSKGQATDVTDANKAYTMNTAKEAETANNIGSTSKAFLVEMANSLRTQYTVTGADQKLLLQTAKDIFEGTGIDASKVIQGDMNELSKINSLGYGSALKLYNKATKVVDPYTSSVGRLNDSWTKPLWEKTSTTRQELKNKLLVREEFLKEFEKNSTNVTAQMMADLTVNDTGLGKHKAELVKIMAGMNHNGFLPPVESDSKTREAIAKKFADDNVKNFRTTGENVQAGSVGTSTLPNVRSGNKSAYDNAYAFAMNNMVDLANEWKSSYKKGAQAYNQMPGGFGGPFSNATTGGGYTFQMDAAAPTHENTMMFADLVNNFRTTGLSNIVQFGDAGAIQGDNQEARAIANQFVLDFFTKGSEKDGTRPKGRVDVQRVAGADENYMSFTFYPDEQWAKQSKLKGSAKQPGITANEEYQKGITVFIPAKQANNSYYKSTEFSDNQFLLNKTGKISIDQYPEVGTLSIEKMGNQEDAYLVSGTISAVDANTGEKKTVPVNSPVYGNPDPDIITKTWTQWLGQMQVVNDRATAAIKSKSGIKDPNVLLK